MSYLIIKLTGGYVDVWSVFLIQNVMLWLYSILLAYQLALIYFEDQYSPFLAALFVTLFPVFTLSLHGIKIQYIGTVFLLAGMFVFEKKIRDEQIHLQFIYFLALFFFGLFAVGGWLFLFLYLFIRHFSLPRPALRRGLTSMTLALLAAQIGLAYLRQAYHLPAIEQQRSLSYSQVLADSLNWLWIWVRGQNVGKLEFLNYSGYSLFTGFIPLIVVAFSRGYWLFLVLSIPAWIFVPRARIFLLSAIPLFFSGHGGTLITGWTFHYGYLSAPAAMMLMLAGAGFLGWMTAHPQMRLKILAIVIVLAAMAGFMDQKLHVSLYYGGKAERVQQRIFLHYGESTDVTEY